MRTGLFVFLMVIVCGFASADCIKVCMKKTDGCQQIDGEDILIGLEEDRFGKSYVITHKEGAIYFPELEVEKITDCEGNELRSN